MSKLDYRTTNALNAKLGRLVAADLEKCINEAGGVSQSAFDTLTEAVSGLADEVDSLKERIVAIESFVAGEPVEQAPMTEAEE